VSGAGGGAMSRDEMVVLLGLIASYDRRVDTSEATVTAWRHALAGYSLGECQAAVIARAHTRPDTLNPANLKHDIDTARQTKATRETVRRNQLDAEQNARNVATIHRGMAKVRAVMGWTAEPGAHDETREDR
jgi:hypothetical protein